MDLLSKLKQEGSEFLTNSEAELALNELEILFKALVKSKCVDRVVFDLSLARGLDYYTGVIFEAVFKGATQVFFYLFNNFFFILSVYCSCILSWQSIKSPKSHSFSVLWNSVVVRKL